MSITLIIIIASVAASLAAMNREELFYRWEYEPYRVIHSKEWYRIFTHGLIHGDWMHLFVNMFVLYNFGRIAEESFIGLFPDFGWALYLILYIGGIAFATLPALRKHRDNPSYRAVGASGAVAAVLFSSILFYPDSKIYIIFIPIGIPAYIFGPLYLAYEIYLDRSSQDNVAHDAHYYGAIFGLLFTILVAPNIIPYFIEAVFG